MRFVQKFFNFFVKIVLICANFFENKQFEKQKEKTVSEIRRCFTKMQYNGVLFCRPLLLDTKNAARRRLYSPMCNLYHFATSSSVDSNGFTRLRAIASAMANCPCAYRLVIFAVLCPKRACALSNPNAFSVAVPAAWRNW